MSHSYRNVMALWVCVWAALYYLSSYQHSMTLTLVSLGLLAAHLTDWLMKALQNTSRRRVISQVSNKAVFITGCDTGFGFELASTLSKIGFKVYAGCLNPEGSGPTALKLLSPRIVVIPCDVTDERQVTQAYTVVEDDLDVDEHLWAVVNNAGIASLTEIEWCSLSTFRRVFEVNALGPVLVTKTFLPLLRQGGAGRVVIVASLAGRYTFPGFSAYSMSKHAVVSFADGLRLEMRKWNISVHTVEPTLYKTPIANVEMLTRNIDQIWDETTPEVRRSYGQEYLQEFKVAMKTHMDKAKPANRVKEVVDDLVDAVAGENPQCHYVPSVETQLKTKVLSSLPVDIRDDLFLKGQPHTPPAFVKDNLQKRQQQPSLVDPRRERVKPRTFRHFSVPNYEKNQVTPPPSKNISGSHFSFENIKNNN